MQWGLCCHYKEAGFANIRLTSEFTHEPAKESDTVFCVLGEKA